MKSLNAPCTILIAFCAFSLRVNVCSAEQPHHSTAMEEARLQAFLKTYVGDFVLLAGGITQFKSAFVDLKDDGRFDALVYISGSGWCGTGGCRLVILAPNQSTYRVITATTITWPPIRVLKSKTNCWHDIGVWVQGGGIQPGYEAKLKFNGKKYPSNPSLIQRSKGKTAGQTLIAREDR